MSVVMLTCFARLQMCSIYQTTMGREGATINFTDEELQWPIHHDLGKVGDLYNEYYTPNESDCIVRIKD